MIFFFQAGCMPDLIASVYGKPRTKGPMTDQQIVDERGKIYGDVALSHESLGLEWTGLLQQHYGRRFEHPLPGWLVAQMLTMFKVHRAARVYHEDNYVDGRNYFRFAQDMQKPWDQKEYAAKPPDVPSQDVSWPSPADALRPFSPAGCR